MLPPPPPPPIVIVDPAGDSGTAPDIAKVTVTTTKKGRINVVVVFKTPFASSSSFYFYFGTDNYRLAPGGLEIWDPPAEEFEPTGDEDATYTIAPGGRALETTISLADIGRPKSFRFVAEVDDGDGGAGHQDAVAGAWPRRR